MTRGESNPETGLPLSAVNLPLIGSRLSPRTAFQYVLHDVGATDVSFACPSWLVRREHFQVGDQIDFHFPFRTADGWHRHHGEIIAAERDEEKTGQVCRATFRERQPLHHPVYASFETGEISFRTEDGKDVARDELLVHVLKDCMLQKRGIAVYFKHLVPLFSRITAFPSEDFGALRAMLLEDVRKRIEANVAAFESWHRDAQNGTLTPATLSRDLDLETLRAATEGEIENDLLDATFDTPVIRPYMDAIRLLEDKLYLNYNTMVLLYAEVL
jgi:hypothetical protein